MHQFALVLSMLSKSTKHTKKTCPVTFSYVKLLFVWHSTMVLQPGNNLLRVFRISQIVIVILTKGLVLKFFLQTFHTIYKKKNSKKKKHAGKTHNWFLLSAHRKQNKKKFWFVQTFYNSQNLVNSTKQVTSVGNRFKLAFRRLIECFK